MEAGNNKTKVNMAENVLVDVIVKVKPNMANRILCRNFFATKCCYSVHFQIGSVGRRLTVKKRLWRKQDKKKFRGVVTSSFYSKLSLLIIF